MKDYNVLDELVPTTRNLHRDIFDIGYAQGYKDGKDKAWEESQEHINDEIKIGDVVNALGFHASVVVIALYDNSVKVMNSFGDTGVHPKCNITKTGRHFNQISEVLEQLKIV